MSSHSRVLLTGGAGFVGSQSVNALLKDGSEVVVFDNLSLLDGFSETVDRCRRTVS